MSTTTQTVWDARAIKHAMRVLGAQESHSGDPQATVGLLRLVRDMLQRRGVQAEMFQVPGIMPLVTAGTGPLLLVTYLDDANPSARTHDGSPPAIDGDLITGSGLTRKAGVLAAIGCALMDPSILDDVTLVIEADRHEGSLALEAWLRATNRRVVAALYEVSDLPIPAPALFHAATGLAVLRATVQSRCAPVEAFYAGVLADVGYQLVDALAAIKSRDAEVFIPDFYEGVTTPDSAGMDTIHAVGPRIGAWLRRGAPHSERDLGTDHLTLGVFCAPSILVREIQMSDGRPHLPSEARALIEARLMPGQDAATIVQSIASFLKRRIPDVTVEPVLVRRPARGAGFAADLASVAPLIPVAPGDSPAGLLEAAGVRTIGFSTASRVPCEEQVSVQSIAAGSAFLASLCGRIGALRYDAGLPVT